MAQDIRSDCGGLADRLHNSKNLQALVTIESVARCHLGNAGHLCSISQPVEVGRLSENWKIWPRPQEHRQMQDLVAEKQADREARRQM